MLDRRRLSAIPCATAAHGSPSVFSIIKLSRIPLILTFSFVPLLNRRIYFFGGIFFRRRGSVSTWRLCQQSRARIFQAVNFISDHREHIESL